MPQQTTIKRKIVLEGIGVHTGEQVQLTLMPAPANAGIFFINTYIPDEKIQVGTVVPEQAMHATVIKSRQWALSTVEHLMAALHGLGIDNVQIELTTQKPQPLVELPILDGSALPFVQAIINAGIETQDSSKQIITPKELLRFEEDDKFLEILPAQTEHTGEDRDYPLTFEYSVDFSHPLIQDTEIEIDLSQFIEEISPARTFGFLAQLPLLRKHGLAKGTSLGNTVVVGEDSFLNSRRFEDEFIRHKLLDLIGDIALVGKKISGTIRAHKTGHSFNRKIVEHYVRCPNAWRVVG